MAIYEHPEYFQVGYRVLMLVGRNKDGCEPRRISRVSRGQEDFNRVLVELLQIARPGERVYASATQRDLFKAMKQFEIAQLNARHSGSELSFYERLEDRWVSSLAKQESTLSDDRWWMFDCDTREDLDLVVKDLVSIDVSFYQYTTKNGTHVLCQPFNRTKVTLPVQKLVDMNPMMLWAYV